MLSPQCASENDFRLGRLAEKHVPNKPGLVLAFGCSGTYQKRKTLDMIKDVGLCFAFS